MTNEEAIAYGKRVIDLGLNDDTQAFCELAIKALETIPKYKDVYGKGWIDGAKASYEHLKMCEEEQDPCEVEAGKLQQAYNKGFEDCRQAVIDTIDKWVKNMGVLITLPANEVTPLFDSIHKLSSVNPQEPSITWVTGLDGAKIAFKDVPAWKVIKICQILADVVEAEEDQEPKADALNKIRAKIEELADADGYGDYRQVQGRKE